MKKPHKQEDVRWAISMQWTRGCEMDKTARQTYQIVFITMTIEMLPIVAVLALWSVLIEVGAEDKITLNKCCGFNQTLNGDATACVPAHQAEYSNIWRAPLNESWLRRWVPPGLPLGALDFVYTGTLDRFSDIALRLPVRTSGLAAEATGDDWRPDRVLLRAGRVLRRRPGGGARIGTYCMDAALRPFPAPFALLLETSCSDMSDCTATCCHSESTLAESVDGSWTCARNRSLALSSVAALRRTFDPEVPIRQGIRLPSHRSRGDFRLLIPEGRRSTHRLSTDASARALARSYNDGFFSTTLSCVSYFVRADGIAEPVVVRWHIRRWSRSFYWCTRPLTFVSVLLLLAAVASIVSSSRLRSSVHGWALGCHAGCLLIFNLLQLAFYLSVSDDADSKLFYRVETNLACIAFAPLTYFFLTAGSCWLTAICLNMSTGFNATRSTRNGRRIRRFLKLSAFAWGIPVILTLTCALIIIMGITQTPFAPTLVETRTCFDEVRVHSGRTNKLTFKSQKWGSALFYYTPMAVLSAINVICVLKTMLRVRFLTRGNSVLRRDTKELYKKDQKEEEAITSQLRISKEKVPRVGSSSGPKSVSVYIRLLLSAGVLELTAETTAWACSTYVDLARAAIVLWLAAPEAGDVRAFSRRLRRSCGGSLLSTTAATECT